jgi:membrane protein implicated in regulation of membrane protease activity
VGLFRSRWFSLGWGVAAVAWGLHVGALALAPLSVVQTVLSGGLVFLAVFAERYFGFRLDRRRGNDARPTEPVRRRGASGEARRA